MNFLFVLEFNCCTEELSLNHIIVGLLDSNSVLDDLDLFQLQILTLKPQFCSSYHVEIVFTLFFSSINVRLC